MIRICSESEKGFTMAELLISVVLIALIATVTFPVFVFSLKANNQNRIRSNANSLATDTIERIKGTPFEQIGNIGGFPEGIFPESTTQKIDGIEYNIKTKITWEERELDGDNNPEAFKNIKVTITAQDAFSESERIFCEMFTSISRDKALKKPKLCAIQAITKFANPDSLTGSYVYAEGPLEKTSKRHTSLAVTKDNYTTEAIFDDLLEGTYKVYTMLPGGYITPEIEQQWNLPQLTKYVSVRNGNQETVNFYMDTAENHITLRIRFVDAATGDPVEPTFGMIYLSWELNGVQTIIHDYTMFKVHPSAYNNYYEYYEVFQQYFKDLWPSGHYNIGIWIDGGEYRLFELNNCTLENAPYVDPVQHDEVTGSEKRWLGDFDDLRDINKVGGYIYIVIPLERDI